MLCPSCLRSSFNPHFSVLNYPHLLIISFIVYLPFLTKMLWILFAYLVWKIFFCLPVKVSGYSWVVCPSVRPNHDCVFIWEVYVSDDSRDIISYCLFFPNFLYLLFLFFCCKFLKHIFFCTLKKNTLHRKCKWNL